MNSSEKHCLHTFRPSLLKVPSPAAGHLRSVTAALLGAASAASILIPIAASAQTGTPVRVVESGGSIQSAIDASAPGTRIKVRPGTYAEQIVITKDRIWIDADTGARLVPPPALVRNGCSQLAVLGQFTPTAPPAHAGICILGDVTFGDYEPVFLHRPVTATKRAVTGVTISGIEVSGFGVGIAAAGAPHLLVERSRVLSGGPFAVVASASPESWIRGNQLINRPERPSVVGLCIEGSDRSSVTRNEISGFINGICLASSSTLIAANELRDNHTGIYVDPGYHDIEIRHNVVSANNRLEQVRGRFRTGEGLVIESARKVQVFGNVITGNTADNVTNGFSVGSAGVVVLDTSPTVVASDIVIGLNTITGNGLDPNGESYVGSFDILNMSSGSGIVLENNRCQTSRPVGLC